MKRPKTKRKIGNDLYLFHLTDKKKKFFDSVENLIFLWRFIANFQRQEDFI